MSVRAPARPRRRTRVRVHGTVQGVGFRPYVYRLAGTLGLDGFVLGSLVLRETKRVPRFLGERNLWRVPLLGRVLSSKTGATLTYGGRSFQSLKGVGFKANYFDVDTGDQFWISGPRRDGADGLYGRITEAGDVDEDVAEAYWRDIRGLEPPKRANLPHVPAQTVKGPGQASIMPTNHGRKHRRVSRTVNARITEAG